MISWVEQQNFYRCKNSLDPQCNPIPWGFHQVPPVSCLLSFQRQPRLVPEVRKQIFWLCPSIQQDQHVFWWLLHWWSRKDLNIFLTPKLIPRTIRHWWRRDWPVQVVLGLSTKYTTSSLSACFSFNASNSSRRRMSFSVTLEKRRVNLVLLLGDSRAWFKIW